MYHGLQSPNGVKIEPERLLHWKLKEKRESRFPISEREMVWKPSYLDYLKKKEWNMKGESSNMCINTLERLDPQFTNYQFKLYIKQ